MPRLRLHGGGQLPAEPLSCHCAKSRWNGAPSTFVTRSSLTLNGGEGALRAHTFNTHGIAHRFCRACGAETFGCATGPRGTPACAINLRCVPAADLDAPRIRRFVGTSPQRSG